MPEFYVDNVDIEPYEFVRECSKSEIKELITELVDSGHLPKLVLNQIDTSGNERRNSSLLEEEFIDKLTSLSNKFYSISKEDGETLETIFNKYI